jgi:hypothetical protein
MDSAGRPVRNTELPGAGITALLTMVRTAFWSTRFSPLGSLPRSRDDNNEVHSTPEQRLDARQRIGLTIVIEAINGCRGFRGVTAQLSGQPGCGRVP